MVSFRVYFQETLVPEKKWAELIETGALQNNLGTLTGVLRDDSTELAHVLNCFENDKDELQIRMEASCQVQYDADDFATHSWFKFYPPDAETSLEQPRAQISCPECNRKVGCEKHDNTPRMLTIEIDAPIAQSEQGDLFLRSDLQRKLIGDKTDRIYELAQVDSPNAPGDWFMVLKAPSAKRLHRRHGFCGICGNAIKTDQLPETDETYILSEEWPFFLSPDIPSLPCFSKELAEWLIDSTKTLSINDFKPINANLE